MNLPNIHFQNFSIEFKEINPSDFPNNTIENNGEKIIISPDERGYITEELLNSIDKESSNTLVINAAVGQGKTTAIIKALKSFYDNTVEDYLIIVASPFVSLVEQYSNEIQKEGIPKEDIYRYEYIGEHPDITYLDKKVHIITVNGILGNPGDDAFINSEAKRAYLNNLSSNCKSQNKKVVLIMDEIHDAIHNFTQEYIFNLWKWKEVLHKNIILSATYNEASKVVIEYLAELTDNRIKIIESERIIIPENQSELFLHFNPAMHFSNTNTGIMSVVQDVITRGKDIDILCYSKNLVDTIVKEKEEGIGGILYSKYEEINKCTSELVFNNRIGRLETDEEDTSRFNNDKCNVGTNFKTGISITKRNHAFVIILPPKGSKLPFSSASGIFSDGINSIIQALARQRKRGGEIHLVLPPPEKFNYDSLPFEGVKKDKFIEFYDLVCDTKQVEYKVKYIAYNTQKSIVEDFFNNTLIENLSSEIELVLNTDRVNKPTLKMPDIKSYLLNKGEKYLANTHKFFGKDLSSYITYCAIANQFINCRLTGYSSKYPLFFRDEEYQITLDFFFENHYLDEDKYIVYNQSSDMYRYLELKNDLFDNYKLFKLKPDNTRVPIQKDKSKEFEIQLLGFLHRRLHSTFNSNFFNGAELFDYQYTRGDYFINCVAIAEDLDLDSLEGDEELTRRVKAYKSLGYFRRKLIDSKQSSTNSTRGYFEYILNKPNDDFVTSQDTTRFNEMIDYLINRDYFISRNIFEFKQRFKPTFTFRLKVKSLYTKLIEDFLEVEDYRLSSGRREKVKLVNLTKELPNPNDTIDLVSNADYHFSEAFWQNNTYDVIDGKLIKR